jgi:flagellar assembly protein FliH
LREGAAKNLLNKSRVVSGKEIIPFDMPPLDKAVRGQLNPSIRNSAEAIEREAYEKGFETGERAGLVMGEQKVMVMLERLEAILVDLTTLKESVMRETETQVIELAVSLARKIVLKEIETRPEEIVGMAREALSRIERSGQITVKINPSLYDLFMKYKPDLLSIHPEVVFDVDPSVPSYGTVVMGPVEEVVTDIDEQIRNLIKDMGDRLASD